MLPRSNFSSFPQYFFYLLLDFHVLAATRILLRHKRLFEISEVEITGVNCKCPKISHKMAYADIADTDQTAPEEGSVRSGYTLFAIPLSSLGWSGGAKVLCILHHWGVQLILAYSWARPAILVVGKGRGGMFLFLLFLHFYSCSSFFPVPLFHLLYSLFYLFSPFLWETTQNDPQGLTCR